MTQSNDGSTPATTSPRSAVSAGVDEGMRVLSYLIGGILAYGLIGWGVDRWLGTHFLLPTGIILGAVLSVYVIIIRFGKTTDADAVPSRTARFQAQFRRRTSRSGQGVGRA